MAEAGGKVCGAPPWGTCPANQSRGAPPPPRLCADRQTDAREAAGAQGRRTDARGRPTWGASTRRRRGQHQSIRRARLPPPPPPPRQARPELRRQVICPILLIRPPCVTCSSILMSQGLVPLAWPCKDPHTNLCKMGLEGVAGHSRRRGARVGEWRLYSMTQNPRGLEQRDGGHGRAAARTPPSTEEDSLTPLGELKHSVR